MNDERERIMIVNSQAWWNIIDRQLHEGKAIVYVLNVCIAEAFKALEKQYIKNRITYLTYQKARENLRKCLILTPKAARKSKRDVKFHDIEINRDMVIGIDRFFESFLKNHPNVGTFDLLILSAAKYLIDFYNYSPDNLIVVTLDNALWQGSKQIPDIPYVYNPNHKSNYADKIFTR
jgi:hypothetical protein